MTQRTDVEGKMDDDNFTVVATIYDDRGAVRDIMQLPDGNTFSVVGFAAFALRSLSFGSTSRIVIEATPAALTKAQGGAS